MCHAHCKQLDAALRKHDTFGVQSSLWVSVSASNAVGRGFACRTGHTKEHHENGTNCVPA